MHIEITDQTRVKEIAAVFSNFYPYLRLEFYGRPHGKFEASDVKDRIDPGTMLRDLRENHFTGTLELLPYFKVAQVETDFQERFGLSVQILRKEKSGWEQTTGMDTFSLKDANEMGRNSSDEFILQDYEEGFEEEEEKPSRLL